MIKEFVRVDPVSLEVGIFKSLPRNQQAFKFQGEKQHGQKRFIYQSPRVLDHVALKVFLAVCSLAQGSNMFTTAAATSPMGAALWKSLKVHGEAGMSKSLVATADICNFLRAAGMKSSGGERKRFIDRLEQLSNVRIHVLAAKTNRGESQMQLLSFKISQDNRRLVVALAPDISHSIGGTLKTQFSQVCMTTLRTLSEPSAIILHAVLSNRIRRSQSKPARYSLGKLVQIAFAEEVLSKVAKHKRHEIVVAALKALDRAGWAVMAPYHRADPIYGIIREERFSIGLWKKYYFGPAC